MLCSIHAPDDTSLFVPTVSHFDQLRKFRQLLPFIPPLSNSSPGLDVSLLASNPHPK